jgi:hypothetical protein
MNHEHVFAVPRYRVVTMCSVEGCTEMRVGTRRGRLRSLTPDEVVSVIARMMEDIAVAEAMTVIHGRERGIARAREVLGYA